MVNIICIYSKILLDCYEDIIYSFIQLYILFPRFKFFLDQNSSFSLVDTKLFNLTDIYFIMLI